jgi:hypothetical protein
MSELVLLVLIKTFFYILGYVLIINDFITLTVAQECNKAI